MPEIHVRPRPRRALPRRVLVALTALVAVALGATGAYLLPSGSGAGTHPVAIGPGRSATPSPASTSTPDVVLRDVADVADATTDATGGSASGAGTQVIVSGSTSASADTGADTGQAQPLGPEPVTPTAPAAPTPPAQQVTHRRPRPPAPDVAAPVYAAARHWLAAVDHRAPQVRPATDAVRSVLDVAAPSTTRVTGVLTGIVKLPVPAAASHR